MAQLRIILTLGPKFYIFSVLSPRICFCFVNPYCIAGIAAFFEILLLAVSKHVLKPSGIVFRKNVPEAFKLCFDIAKRKISKNAADPAKQYGFTKQKHIRGDKTLEI